ncbi:MAG: cytochrome c biogenesis protein CcsA [Planctomycetes bacterium]|nr:cytochrome c biogenesis protein CcsA [Planctomycetota bacterium]
MHTRHLPVLAAYLLFCATLAAQDAPDDPSSKSGENVITTHGPKEEKPEAEAAHVHDHDHDHAHDHGEVKAALTGDLDFKEAGLIAVQDGGRKKPLHTLASENVENITGRPFFLAVPYWKDPKTKFKYEALDVFLSIWLGSRSREDWLEQPIVLVSYLPLRQELGLSEADKRFSVRQILKTNGKTVGKDGQPVPRILELVREAHEASQAKGAANVPELQNQASIVYQRCQIMNDILNGETAFCVPHPNHPDGSWISVGTLEALSRGSTMARSRIVMEHTRGDEVAADKLMAAYLGHYSAEQAAQVARDFAAFRDAYLKRDAAAFTSASRTLRQTLENLSPGVYPAEAALAREIDYNQTRPFNKAWILYLLAAILATVTLRVQSKVVRGLVMAVFLSGLAYHVYGFAVRCLISGRPPVTNMFESVVWVGFGAVLFGLVFELIYKPRYFLICGACGGFLCLVLMDMLPAVLGNPEMPGFEASIKPLVPVLRDNFWLTIHVLTITLSYAAFILAWVLGHVTLGQHLIWPGSKNEHRTMHQFVYRVLQVGVLLLAIGTILGGVWAYYSWGRFWGWDPKETWAFIGLIFYLIVLHGRFTGWWANFGMCVGAVLGFWPIMMAWYGVNFVLPKLGQGGLHAYGAGSGGEYVVLSVAGVDIFFTAVSVARDLIYRRSAGASVPAKLTKADPIEDARAQREAGSAVPQTNN